MGIYYNLFKNELRLFCVRGYNFSFLKSTQARNLYSHVGVGAPQARIFCKPVGVGAPQARIFCKSVGVGAHDDPAIPWLSLNFSFIIIRGGGPMAQAPLNKLCLATLCSASQKAGHFPCGKSLLLPRAPADISA